MTAQSRVERWWAFYTRGLPAEVASERCEELAADVLDHTEWSTEQGIGPASIARSITWRAVKGIPSDLAWRRAQLWAADTVSLRTRFFDGWLLVGAHALGLGLILLALTAVIRNGWRIFTGDAPAMATFVAALVIACGLLLTRRERTRPIGALWLAVGAPVVTTFGVGLLAQSTTMLLLVSQSTPYWGTGLGVVAGCVSVFYLAAAAWWMPERKVPAR
jgi:hypothetical protein